VPLLAATNYLNAQSPQNLIIKMITEVFISPAAEVMDLLS
jgi:hypothetical protein